MPVGVFLIIVYCFDLLRKPGIFEEEMFAKNAFYLLVNIFSALLCYVQVTNSNYFETKKLTCQI